MNMDGTPRRNGWHRDRNRGMLYDKTGRFRIFKSCGGNGSGTVCYVLEDRKENQCCLFELESLAVTHAEAVKEMDSKCRWMAERKRKVNAEIEFRHVTASGGFYYWKKDAAKKWREQRCKD